jgi:Zn-finger protein
MFSPILLIISQSLFLQTFSQLQTCDYDDNCSTGYYCNIQPCISLRDLDGNIVPGCRTAMISPSVCQLIENSNINQTINNNIQNINNINNNIQNINNINNITQNINNINNINRQLTPGPSQQKTIYQTSSNNFDIISINLNLIIYFILLLH